MFSTREVPWMKKGNVIDVPGVTAEYAAILGGLNFAVEKHPAGYRVGKKWVPDDNYMALIRQDTGDNYGFASSDYELVQYRDAFAFLDDIGPKFVSAGALYGGRQGFVVVELPERFNIDLTIKGKADPHNLYVIVRTSQDRTRAIEIILTTLRGMCMNQLTLPSLKRGAKQAWSIRHTPNARERMEQAKDVIKRTDEYVTAFQDIATSLADIDVDFDKAMATLHHVLPDLPKRDNQVNAIMDTFNHGETVGFPGTGWGLVNAVEEYFEWLRPNHLATFESQFSAPLDGQAHRMTEKTVRALLNA